MNAALTSAFTLFLFAGAGEEEPLVVTKDLTLEKGSVLRGGIVIRASHVTLDGGGAAVQALLRRLAKTRISLAAWMSPRVSATLIPFS